MWQIMLGGVFDRHPTLMLMMTEVRADWLPATLGRLDEACDTHGNALSSRHKSSEWWRTNCLAGVSFMHKSEVEMRHEIGGESMNLGRDYPHGEGTWPNTFHYLRDDLFAGVPEHEVRLILGENAVRFLGLDAAKVAEIAERVGPSIDWITGGADIDPNLIAHFGDRSGYLQPADGRTRLDEIDEFLRPDPQRLASSRR